jgi:hypothetical protein
VVRLSTAISSAILRAAATGIGVLDAMGDVIVQDLLLDPPERRAHRPRICPSRRAETLLTGGGLVGLRALD